MDQSAVEFIARVKLRFFIGMSILMVVMNLFTILTFAKVWAPTFQFYGIPPIVIEIILPALFILSCYCVGHYWDMVGIWNREADYTNQANNPQVLVILDDLTKIKNKLGIKEEKK
jgi:hypothetical protein